MRYDGMRSHCAVCRVCLGLDLGLGLGRGRYIRIGAERGREGGREGEERRRIDRFI
jgi:hypothetical protein